MYANQKAALTAFLEDRTTLDVPGNALIIQRGDQELFRHFTGSAAPDTLFRIFSMTKVVTVTAALQLYEQGLFTLDDPLAMYLPEYANMTVWDEKAGKAVPAKNTIRIRDLFCMTAGLSYTGDWCETARGSARVMQQLSEQYGPDRFPTREFARALAGVPLMFEPGTHWNYSLCHDVLGAVIEVISGQTLGSYMHDHIFAPLGMEHTFFRCPAELRDRIAPAKPAQGDTQYDPEARFESGGAGLLSTADDYLRFARTLTGMGTSPDGVRILGRKTVELMRMDELNAAQKADYNWRYLAGYSYGLGVRTLLDPVKAGVPGSVGEFGWCGMLGTWTLMDPAEELTVVYMHQRQPNLEDYVQTHLRTMIYAML